MKPLIGVRDFYEHVFGEHSVVNLERVPLKHRASVEARRKREKKEKFEFIMLQKIWD